MTLVIEFQTKISSGIAKKAVKPNQRNLQINKSKTKDNIKTTTAGARRIWTDSKSNNTWEQTISIKKMKKQIFIMLHYVRYEVFMGSLNHGS